VPDESSEAPAAPEEYVPETPEVPEESYTPEVPAAPETEYVPDYTDSTDYSDLNSAIVSSALQLVGVTDGLQCTEVVQLALAGAGVSDAQCLWPQEYQAVYGYYTDDPQPGNLIYYDQGGNGVDHIAIYIGDGMAVHGNFQTNGESHTVVASVEIAGTGVYQYIQVER
jgi:cell wall-associated NlpC family hydrolase